MTTDPFPAGGQVATDRRDAYLCFCEEITAEDFRAAVAAAPDRTFEEICASTGLATKCTACLLNAENLFVEVDQASTAEGRKSGVSKGRRADRVRGRHRLYRLVDAVSPKVARRVPGIIPVIAGDGIRTILAFANTVPPLIGEQAPAFEVDVSVFDADGNKVASHTGRVLPDKRLEFDISQNLPAAGGVDCLVTGTCILSYRAAARGYIGSIRPHFKVVTKRAASSVHSAGAGRQHAYVQSCRLNRRERQFVSAVNCTDVPAQVSMKVRCDAAETTCGSWQIPGYGARLLEIPEEIPFGEMFAVEADADRDVRWHYVVAEGEPPAISLDHI